MFVEFFLTVAHFIFIFIIHLQPLSSSKYHDIPPPATSKLPIVLMKVMILMLQVSFMPILVLAARLCPPGVEATLFATLMSISNGGGVTGGILGAGLTQLLGVTSQNFQNLALLLVLCNASSLLPLPFLGLLPSDSDLEAAVEKAEQALDNLANSKEK